MAVLALAACASAGQPAPVSESAEATPAEGAPPVAPAERVDLVMWTAWGGQDDVDRVRIILDEFQELHPGIMVELTGGGPGGGDYNELLLTRIAAGNAPDVASLFTPPVGFAARGSLDVIDELMATAEYARPDKFWQPVLDTCKFRGKTYGLPFSAASYGMFYNVDWFEEAGLPTDRESFPQTFDELRALSAQFVAWEGDELKTGGFVPWSELWTSPAWSGCNGAQWFDSRNEQYTINDPGNIALLQYWVGWLDEQYRGDVEYIASLGAWHTGQDGNWFQKVTPLSQGGAWNTSYSYMKYETAGFRWDVAKFPVGPDGEKSRTAFWPNWFAMPIGGPHRTESFLLMEYMCTVGMPTWYAEVFDTPAWLDFPDDVITQNLIDNVGADKALEMHNFFIDYLEDAVEVWTSPIEDFGTDQINRAIDQVMHKVKTPQEALDEAQQIAQTRLEETLRSL